MIKTLAEIKALASQRKKVKVAVAGAEDEEILQVVSGIREAGLADFILVGDEVQIRAMLPETEFEIENAAGEDEAAQKAVECVRCGKAEAIMKGMLQTSTFLKALLDKEKGLRGGKLLSQVSVYDKADGSGLLFLTDCAMAIEPDLEEKILILKNVVKLAQALGYEEPRVAVLSALEVVNPKIKDTVDAAVLSKMNERNQIKDCIVDGPLAFDNAVSEEAARHKGIKSPVAGRADIILAPNLQVGNAVHKTITYIAGKASAAAVIGAAAPVIMTSRTDSMENKVLSAALAIYLAG